jgi:hypothetical protein
MSEDGSLSHHVWSNTNTNYYNLYNIELKTTDIALYIQLLQTEFKDPNNLLIKDFNDGFWNMVLERHGQNVPIDTSTAGLEAFASELGQRFNLKEAEKLEIAWTFEIYPNFKDRLPNDNAFFISELGTRDCFIVYLFNFLGVKNLMSGYYKYPRGGIQELNNYQSSSPFLAVSEWLRREREYSTVQYK